MVKRAWIVMGSDSDLKVMSEAAKVLDDFGIGYRISIASAHRCLDKVTMMAKGARDEGFAVIIAGAGLAAHLPGVIAAATILPVIGVPLKSGAIGGIDALYAMVQMPPGIPVASVAIDGAKNAGLLAVEIMALGEETLAQQLADYKIRLAVEVQAKDDQLQQLGYRDYLLAKERGATK